MNTVRLVFGWLFLAGFTAAGTYYAMDEADQRVGLGRFQLHEKFGLVKMAAMQAPINNQVPPNNNPPPVYVPPNNQNPPNTNPSPVYVPPNNQNPPSNVTPPPYTPPNNQNPPNNVTPPPYTPPNNNQNPPNNNTRPVYVPPNNNQLPPNTNPPVNPPNNVTPPITQQRQRPADFTETNIRLVQIQGQATRLRSTIARMRGPYGTARLDEPMSNLTTFLRQAESALSSGDTAAARRYMDQADVQVGKLKELLDQ